MSYEIKKIYYKIGFVAPRFMCCNSQSKSMLFHSDVIQIWSFYRMFHGCGHAQLYYGGLVLGSSQFLSVSQLTKKMPLT